MFFLKKKIPGLRHFEFLMKLKFPSYVTRKILVLLNKDKIFDLRKQEILFSLKIPSYEKLAMASKFGFTRFSNSGIPDLLVACLLVPIFLFSKSAVKGYIFLPSYNWKCVENSAFKCIFNYF